MGFNKGTSAYHCVQGLYWRNAEGELLAVEGSNSYVLPDVWDQIWGEIRAEDATWTEENLPCGKDVRSLQIKCKDALLSNIKKNFPPKAAEEELVTRVAEMTHSNGLILGMLTSRPQSLADDAFCTFAEYFILTETEFEPFATLCEESDPEHIKIVEDVTAIFERTLKNLSRDDQWGNGGREIFMNRVYGYVQQDRAIQHALPAFPCKSPNPNKVGGTMPDLAEHIALEVLRSYIMEVNKVYKHGATMWVISDGIVFSDCIGVDDKMIDTYDDALAQIYHEKYGAVEKGPVPAIKFKGLKHIFMEDPATLAGLKESWLMGVQMPHPVKTEIDNEVEVCRKLMLGVAGADRKFIRSCIDQQEEHAVSLYRGQTRFMLEDLAGVPSIKSLSNKQKKKTAALVAEEMMSRNQGYSNLTELLLTNYVRLSIHAHDNSGPKFAVRLLPKTMVRPIQDLEKRHEPVAAYEFQLPTPWHNTIIKVEGDEYIYLARSEIAKKAIAGTDYEGSWVEGPEGGHYSLTRKPAALMKRPTLALVTKQGINHVKQRVREMRTPQKTSAPFSPKPLSRTKTQPLFSPMCAEPVAWVTPVEKPAHPFTPLAERRVKTIFTPAPGTFKDPPTPIAQKGRSATGFVSSKSTASASSSSNGKITILPLPDKVKSILSDKSKTPPPAEQPKPSTVATVVEEQEPVTPPPEVVNAPAAAKPDITVAPAAEQPATTTTAATVTSAPAAEPQSTTPSEKTEVAPVSIKAQKRQTFYNIFSQKATATVTPINEKLTVETQSNVKRRSAFGNFMKRLGVVQSPA